MLTDPPGLDRGAILFPYQYDGAASLNVDAQHGLIHAVTVCGRWIVVDAQSGQSAQPIQSLDLFVTNTPAVDPETGTLYVVGVPHAGAIAGFAEPPDARSWLLVRVPLPRESKADILGRDDLRFVDVLLLGLLGNMFDAESGLLLALTPGDSGFARKEVSIQGSSETSPAIGRDGTVYLSDGIGNFIAFDRDLNEKWRFPLAGGESFGSPAIDPSGAVYVVAGPPGATGVYKLRDCQGHVETEWFFGGSQLRNGSSAELHPVQMVVSVFTPTASGVGYCLGYELSPWTLWAISTARDYPFVAWAFRPPAQVFCIELRTGRLLDQAVFDTFSFTGALPVGPELLAPSFDLLDERYGVFGLLDRPAGVSVYDLYADDGDESHAPIP
jgi:hypothetical protein